MTVEDDHLLEPVIGQALGDVHALVKEMPPADRDTSREVHPVGDVPVGHRRHHQELPLTLGGRLLGDPVRYDPVSLQGEVRAVLLDAADREDGYLAFAHRIVDIRPGQLVEVGRLVLAHVHPSCGARRWCRASIAPTCWAATPRTRGTSVAYDRATVHMQTLARDVAGIAGSEEDHGLPYVLDCLGPLHRKRCLTELVERLLGISLHRFRVQILSSPRIVRDRRSHTLGSVGG